MGTRYVGTDGESTACDYLTGIGATILGRNVRIGGGEIDIIALINGTIAFIEVKRRTGTLYGRPSEAVTAAKQRKIVRAAALYAAMHGYSDAPMRFDVIELLPGEINHIPSAFTADGVFR